MIQIEETTIRPIPPFDFELSALVFRDGDRQIRKYEDGKYWQVLRINDELIRLCVKTAGTVDEPCLSIEFACNCSLTRKEKGKATERARVLFNSDLDLNRFYEDIRQDPILATIARNLRGLRSPTTSTVFEALIDSIVEQQISLNVASGMETKMIRAFGEELRLEDQTYFAYPTPEKLASLQSNDLRRCGLSSRKAEYVINLSRLIADGKLDLEKLKNQGDSTAIITELDEIRGIGIWTAELTVIRAMQRFDVIPADDLGLRRVISHYYSRDAGISGEEARRTASKWGKWKGLAAFYLIIADILEKDDST